jgi:hypothetical protein
MGDAFTEKWETLSQSIAASKSPFVPEMTASGTEGHVPAALPGCVQGWYSNSGPGIGTAALAWGVGMLAGYELRLGQMTDGGDHGGGGGSGGGCGSGCGGGSGGGGGGCGDDGGGDGGDHGGGGGGGSGGGPLVVVAAALAMAAAAAITVAAAATAGGTSGGGDIRKPPELLLQWTRRGPNPLSDSGSGGPTPWPGTRVSGGEGGRERAPYSTRWGWVRPSNTRYLKPRSESEVLERALSCLACLGMCHFVHARAHTHTRDTHTRAHTHGRAHWRRDPMIYRARPDLCSGCCSIRQGKFKAHLLPVPRQVQVGGRRQIS